MSSSSKKRQTMAKIARERLVKEKRAIKREKKDARKAAAAEQAELDTQGVPGEPLPEPTQDASAPLG